MKKHRLLVFGTFAALLIAATIIGCTGTGGILFNGGAVVNTVPRFLVGQDEFTAGATNVYPVTSPGVLGTPVATSPQAMAGTLQVETLLLSPTKDNILYAADFDDGKIHVWSIDSAGKLTELGATATDGFFYRRNSLAITPNGNCLYAVTGNTKVDAFSIGADNLLTAKTPVDFSGEDATGVSGGIAATNSTVYFTNVDNDKLLFAPINSDCSVNTAAGKDIDSGTSFLRSLAISPSGKHLVVGDDNSGGFTTFNISAADGSLAVSQTTQNIGDCDVESMAFSTDGKFLYASDCDEVVDALAFDDTAGTVANTVPGNPFFTNDSGGMIVVSRDNKSVFTSGECDPIWGFARDTTTGALSPATGNKTTPPGNNVCAVALTY